MEGKWAQMLWCLLALTGIVVGVTMSYQDLLWSADGWDAATGEGQLMSWAFSIASTVMETAVALYMLKAHPWAKADTVDKVVYGFIALAMIYDIGTNWLGIFPQTGSSMLSGATGLVGAMKIVAGFVIAFSEYLIAVSVNSLKYHYEVLQELG